MSAWGAAGVAFLILIAVGGAFAIGWSLLTVFGLLHDRLHLSVLEIVAILIVLLVFFGGSSASSRS